MNAAHRESVILARGTTEGINLVAQVIEGNIKVGRNCHQPTRTPLEYRAWQLLAQRTGAKIRPLILMRMEI